MIMWPTCFGKGWIMFGMAKPMRTGRPLRAAFVGVAAMVLLAIAGHFAGDAARLALPVTAAQPTSTGTAPAARTRSA